MSTEHKTSEESIYYEAVAKPPKEREVYLQAACGQDAALLARVKTLLEAREVRDSFLESAPWDPAVILDTSPITEGAGTVIGRYKLLEKIGEGGMAVVYMAEQQEPIRRKVALKIIKLGMDTRQVIARFEAERQALALMDHPSIAKVLDAGATETGRPYFVMELVTGVSITEYCDKNNLSTKDRLALFLQVCHAVQHAHQKGIIHRDLKPSNVMVTHHDGKPIPKVIDFGIAKATNQKLTERTLFTRYAHIIGTPAYMSPEQAELSDLDVDTRSDIYSLGVLLYELLTGTTPFSEEDLRKAGYIEMQRVIREQEPVKPSTRIRTALRGASVPARRSSMGVPPMLREVRGDLDWIVMKSLEKDRARRYETASGLAEDVRRHLEHEPIFARGPSTAYRLRKFLRRHRVQALGVLAAAAVAIAAVVVLSLWNRDRLQLAEAEGFRHKNILSQAREQYAKADREAALETIKPILQSPHVGPEAQLLQAGILVDNRRSREAVTILDGLLNERPEIAGAAHALLARILWESGSLNAEKLKEIDEHRQKAETLLPETAEAYFLRAMTALTVKEQLASLDRALQLDPGHYESRRLRAFTYYASRKYDRLQADALGMTILRPRDPLGYSLRAVAWRELGRYQDSIADYDSALALTAKDSPAYVDLSTQRCETLLRMGDHERVIAEAQAYTSQVGAKDFSPLQYHVFCALTALGDYEKATALFRQIITPGHEARRQFQDWCGKYVFDALGAGRSWHPADREPAGAAFLPMVEAEETYRDLSAKGRRVTTDGFSARWSPDGKRLAFSLGVHGYSGVAVFDPATKETDLLIVPGKDPRWSPDGRYIAFVRDCEFLRLSELAVAEPMNQQRALADEEVWLMKSDGTEPRRLARGGWPSWNQDSTCVYYQSRVDNALCSISIVSRNAEPKRIMACANFFPSVSPDNQRVAYLENASLKVKDLASQALIAEWPVPFAAWGGVGWSPTGRELCLAGRNDGDDRTGLWIYSLDRSEPARILGGQITVGSWAPDGTKLVFCLGPACFDLWAADLAPNIPTIEALGPGQTLAEHFQEMVAFYTRRIEADPLDAYAYSDRARYYDCLHDQEKANADMRWWSAILNHGRSLDLQLGTLRDFRHVISGPFNYQLVFSVERHENQIPVLCIAFGQKGRGDMKRWNKVNIPLLWLGLAAGVLATGDAAQADFVIGTPVNLGPAINSPVSDMPACISADGLSLFFSSNRSPGGYRNFDLWVATRQAQNEDWGTPIHMGDTINSRDMEWTPCISADGLELYFAKGPWGNTDIVITRRNSVSEPWGTPENLGPVVNSTSWDMGPSITADGLELFFCSTRSGGFGGPDLYVTRRASMSDPWGPPVNLGPTVNTSYGDSLYGEWTPSISQDGLALFFASARPPGSASNLDIWLTRRTTREDGWGPPVHLEHPINSPYLESSPCISADGRTLYFVSARPGGVGGDSDFWQAPVIPIVDFNGDGKVDGKDVLVMTEHWGQSSSLCDIGPSPWGDGVVDEKDLMVLMESVMSPGPHATEIPCDVVLSWISPSFAKACDVYFGTSREAVNSADRANPQGVLVSLAQTATTYDPAGLLDFSRTYYWRVDFVIPGPTPTIYQGPVLSFTTEAFAYPIKNVAAKASSSQSNMGPERTVDGSGLDKSDGHSTNGADMWLSMGAQPNWIQYQFDKVYALHELWVWNSNQMVEPFIGFGAKSVKIEYSTDGTTWTPLANVPEFARAPGQPGYTPNTKVSFGGVSAKYVKLTIEKGWGTTPSTGLSEVRFFYIPTAAVPKP